MNRPTSVTVFGILNIAFSVWGVIGIAASIVLFLIPANTNNPVIQLMHQNPAYAMWLKVCIPLGLVSCLVLLVAGIGLLLVKSWGRGLSIGYAIYAIVFGLLSAVVNFIFLVRPMLEQAQHQHGPEAAGAIGGAIGSSIGSCLGMIYPIILLLFMFRPKVAAAFRTSPSLPV